MINIKKNHKEIQNNLTEFCNDNRKELIREIILFIPRFIKLLYDLIKDPEIPRKGKIISLFCISYLINPFDIVPDFIPIIGQVDDLFIVMLGIGILIKLAGREKIERYWTGNRAITDIIEEINELVFLFLDEKKLKKLKEKFFNSIK